MWNWPAVYSESKYGFVERIRPSQRIKGNTIFDIKAKIDILPNFVKLFFPYDSLFKSLSRTLTISLIFLDNIDI